MSSNHREDPQFQDKFKYTPRCLICGDRMNLPLESRPDFCSNTCAKEYDRSQEEAAQGTILESVKRVEQLADAINKKIDEIREKVKKDFGAY